MSDCKVLRAAARAVVAGWLAAWLVSSAAQAFSITEVSLTPPSPVPAGVPLSMTVSLAAPSGPVWLYQPTTVSVQGNQVAVDLYPNSGMLTVIGHLSTNVDLGILPAGKYDYEVRLPPTFTVSWSELTNRGSFTVLPGPVPAVVSITAPEPEAVEPGLTATGKRGRFTIHRCGLTNVDLRVRYAVSGTARNGVDYASITNVAFLAAGETEANIVIQPLPDALTEGKETVVLRLLEPICPDIYPPPPECYQVGLPREATMYILDGLVDTRPVVTLLARDPVAAEGTNCYRWPGWPRSLPAGGCRTNTAAFVVQRTGDTPTSLTVFYTVGGTASNGVDYALLPGAVEIPAGQRLAPIILWPVDDTVREKIETVILGLVEPPYASPLPAPYRVGRPARAAAIIVDNDQPRPCTERLPDRCFHLMQPGTNGQWFRIEGSTNLRDWTVLCTNSVTDGAIHFVDPDADNLPERFYRVVSEPQPAAE